MLVLCSVDLMGNIHLRQKAPIFTTGNIFLVLLLKGLQPSLGSSPRILTNVSSIPAQWSSCLIGQAAL